MFMNIVPCYTIIASVVMPNMCAVACGAALAVDPPPGGHLVADVDGLGRRHVRSSRFHGHGFRQGLDRDRRHARRAAGRDPENLTAGMLVVIPRS